MTFSSPSLQFRKLSLAKMIIRFFGIATWKTNFDIVEVLLRWQIMTEIEESS